MSEKVENSFHPMTIEVFPNKGTPLTWSWRLVDAFGVKLVYSNIKHPTAQIAFAEARKYTPEGCNEFLRPE